VRLSALVETSDSALLPIGELERDPDVRDVVTTDLLDPRRYLSGGELVLTGLAWWRPQRPRRTREFVEALIEARVAALAAGEAELGEVPDDLIDACREAGLPLLRVPIAVSFGAVTEHAARHLSSRRSGDLAAVLGRHRALISAVSGSGLVGVLDLVESDLDLRCWVLSPTGRLVAGADRAPDEHERRLLAQHYLRAGRLPHKVRRPGGQVVSLFGEDSSRVDSWLLAIDGDHSGWIEERGAVVDELTQLIAAERLLFHRRSDVELAGALVGGGPDEVSRAVRRSGFDPGQPAVVVVAVGRYAAAVLAEGLADQAWAWTVGAAGDEAVGIVATGEPADLVTCLRAALDQLSPGLSAESLRIGVSDAVTGDGLVAAVNEARAAAAAGSGPHSVCGPDRLGSYAVLLGAVPGQLRRAYRSRVLGPLLEHDRAHRTDLVATLAMYLECSGSWARCAERMHVHVNTLRYRIERIEALTGRDLRRLEDQADLLLALQA
jgi:hypothetical protein